jgi:hypothetical protein
VLLVATVSMTAVDVAPRGGGGGWLCVLAGSRGEGLRCCMLPSSC